MEKLHEGGKNPEKAVCMDRRMEEVEVKGQAPDLFTHGIKWTAGSTDPRAGTDLSAKSKISCLSRYSKHDPSVFQPVAQLL